eukprot:2158024-Pyramimonas_sp.AAC.1
MRGPRERHGRIRPKSAATRMMRGHLLQCLLRRQALLLGIGHELLDAHIAVGCGCACSLASRRM